MKALGLVLVALLLAIPAAAEEGEAEAAEAASLPRFEPGRCWVDAAAELGREGVRCGYLIVPERRDVAEPRLLRLAVAILPARSDEPLPDPVLYLHGGPGGRAVTSAAFWFASGLRDEREIILLDQRGSGLSEPSLCPGMGVQDFRVMAADHAPGTEIADRKTVALACRDELLAQGIDLGAWNSTTGALDVEDLRLVLGIEEWNLLGVSYGTRLALAVMRLTNGEGLRSVVLDSTYPPWAPAWDSTTPVFSRSLDAFFSECEDDVACDDRFADLRMRIRQMLVRLETNPVRSRVEDTNVLPDGLLVNNAQDTAILIHQMLYDSRMYSTLPLLLDRLEARSRTVVQNLANLMTLRALSLSRATNLIVECYERAPFQDKKRQARYGEADPLIHRVHSYFDADYEICAEWSDQHASAAEVRPVRVDVPTVTFGGRFDPITPPDWGERTSRTLPDSHHFEFPVGHGAYRTDACPREIAEAFVDDPSVVPDDGCIARMEPLSFVTRWRSSPGTLPLVRGLILDKDPAIVAPLAAGVGGLGLGLLLLPLGARLRRWRGDAGVLERPASRSWALGTALLVLGFWLGLLGAVVWTASEQPMLLVVGLPFWTNALFWVPWLALPVGLAAGAILWRDRAVGAWSDRCIEAGLLLVSGCLLGLRFLFEL